jgi:hypothetical protein
VTPVVPGRVRAPALHTPVPPTTHSSPTKLLGVALCGTPTPPLCGVWRSPLNTPRGGRGPAALTLQWGHPPRDLTRCAWTWGRTSPCPPTGHGSYLVDPASSHMLVSKIKPCMSKYKQVYTVKLRMAHYNSYSLFDSYYYLDNRGNSRANTCVKHPHRGWYLLDSKPMQASAWCLGES